MLYYPDLLATYLKDSFALRNISDEEHHLCRIRRAKWMILKVM